MSEARLKRQHREFAWVWVLLVLVLSVAAGICVTVLLWGGTRAEHRDAFDTGWKSAAAVLAILAAVITVERLRLSQREHYRQLVADEARREADRAAQITDLSSKASEQLGNEKAAVRIGGLTDLERLARSHPSLQQTVADRICAYLRAPYKPPPLLTTKLHNKPVQEISDDEIADRRLELDVRRTAQQILQRHLHWPKNVDEVPDDFWADIRLDLRDAVLVDFNLDDARLEVAVFDNARFLGYTSFGNARLLGPTSFNYATFNDADFTRAWFIGPVRFEGVSFSGRATFRRAKFAEAAQFTDASFAGAANFEDGLFNSTCTFYGASFAEEASFAKASFIMRANFDHVSFSDSVTFDDCVFSMQATLAGATFAKRSSFLKARFSAEANFVHASFLGDALFDGAYFTKLAIFDDVKFGGTTTIDNATYYMKGSFYRINLPASSKLDTRSENRRPVKPEVHDDDRNNRSSNS
ncbi:pentapeptide repeat-containing protein [Amycolatopsis sp. H6(2020)]|nr:pentapeptide repeat-containing protein [Amycolatopsis sp. H6(2020)]